MASTYTTSLRFELQATGENRASWGTKTNTNFAMVEEAISGQKTIAMSDANLTLTKVNAATDQSRPIMLRFTGTLTANRTITIPTVSKIYFMYNGTSGEKVLTISNGSSSYALQPLQWKMIFTDGATIWNGDQLLSSGSERGRYDITPRVMTNGVMDIGRYIDFHNADVEGAVGSHDFAVRLETAGTTTDLYIYPSTGTLTGRKIYHTGNDGAGSGLDADTVDGKHANDIGFPDGTVMLFVQTAAPTGWIKSTAHNNKALRVTTGTVTSGGTVNFDTVFASVATSAVTLTTAQIPAHTHTYSDTTEAGGVNHTHTFADSGNTSTAGSHTHTTPSSAADNGDSGPLVLTQEAGREPISSASWPNTNPAGNHAHTFSFSGTTGTASAYSHSHTISGSVAANTGGGGSHAHTVNLDVRYVDAIIATRDI